MDAVLGDDEAALPGGGAEPDPGTAGDPPADCSSMERTAAPAHRSRTRSARHRRPARLLLPVVVGVVSLALVVAAFVLALAGDDQQPGSVPTVTGTAADGAAADGAAADGAAADGAAADGAAAGGAVAGGAAADGAEAGIAGVDAARPAPAVLRREGLDALLQRRADAVLRRDRQAWLATVSPVSADFAGRQAAAFENLAEVPLVAWGYEYAGAGPALSAERRAELGPEATTVRVVLAYRLSGADTGDVRREQTLTLVPSGDGWLVAGDRDGRTATDLWDLGPVSVARGSRSLVLGTVPADDLERYVTEADAAAEQVDRVWGTAWPRTVVVQVPRDQQEMARLLLRDDPGGLEQVAAVTTGELGLEPDGARANRVVVNPGGFAQLGPLGRSVVLTHELTHVATRAASAGDVPIWLSEGFADLVAYSGTDLPRRVVAGDVLADVRDGDVPRDLPGPQDFDPADGDIAPAYSGSWLAVDLLDRRYGRAAVIDLYRQVAAGRSVDAGLRIGMGTDLEAFRDDWAAYLEELAHDAS